MKTRIIAAPAVKGLTSKNHFISLKKDLISNTLERNFHGPVLIITKSFFCLPTITRVKVSIVGSLRDREVACSASDRQGSNFESCVWRTVSSQSSHHPQEVLLAQFSLYVHKGGLKPDSFIHSFQVIFIRFKSKSYFCLPTISSHLHPLQVENCDSNSQLVVDEEG